MYCVQYLTGKWFVFKKIFCVLYNCLCDYTCKWARGWKSKGPQFIEGVLLPSGGHGWGGHDSQWAHYFINFCKTVQCTGYQPSAQQNSRWVYPLQQN